jgi:hypothetical protein
VATQELGDLGARESRPAVVQWRWHYHVPSLGVWALLVALLVLVKPNRHAQAWLIWLPILAVLLGWSMLTRLLSLSPQTADPMGSFLTALAASWATVWLLAPWLARRRFPAAFAIALAAMLAVGGLYYYSVYGSSGDAELFMLGLLYAVGVLSLLVATSLGAYFCRPSYEVRRFIAWSLLWTVVVPVLSIPLVVLGSALFWAAGTGEFVGILLMALISSLVGGGVLGMAIYLLNLPFLVLAIRNPFFAARFQETLRLTPAVSDAVSDAMRDAMADGGPGEDADSDCPAPVIEIVPATMVEES